MRPVLRFVYFGPVFALLSASLCAQKLPLDGFVTDAGTPAQFAVEGYPVLCLPGDTQLQHRQGEALLGVQACPQHFLGEELIVSGQPGKARGSIRAEAVLPVAPEKSEVSGFALTDEVLARGASGVTVRGDGYTLVLTPQTVVEYEPFVTPSLKGITTNQWIRYAGTLAPDGRVAVKTAHVYANVIDNEEDRLRKKQEFDPAKVSEDDRQSVASRYFLGVNRKRIPASQNKELQTRVTAVGATLVPAYQRALPPDDPSRIDFRFQLVDDRRDVTFAMSNGIVLVSESAAERLSDDSQLAFILGVGVAAVLEKQELRAKPTEHLMAAGSIGGNAAILLGSGLGVVGVLASAEEGTRLQLRIMRATDREALCLMHDVGYDVSAAPIAVRLLEAKKAGKLAGPPLSEDARYLYQLLGTAWTVENREPKTAAGTSSGVLAQ